jgi:hypothetical protein
MGRWSRPITAMNKECDKWNFMGSKVSWDKKCTSHVASHQVLTTHYAAQFSSKTMPARTFISKHDKPATRFKAMKDRLVLLI